MENVPYKVIATTQDNPIQPWSGIFFCKITRIDDTTWGLIMFLAVLKTHGINSFLVKFQFMMK